jgi:hypothetical protein
LTTAPPEALLAKPKFLVDELPNVENKGIII